MINDLTLDDCKFILEFMVGVNIYDAAKLTVKTFQMWPTMIDGFIFNGHIIQCLKEDTVDTLIDKYRKADDLT
jgi:hypothetical protein